MKLQINQLGSWRNVVSFDDDKETFVAVGNAVVPLARILGKSASWRITEDNGEVIAYCEAPNFTWVKP